MKSFAKLLAVAVTLVLTSAAAHADPITGEIQLAGGIASYSSSSITFSNAGNEAFNNPTDIAGTLGAGFDGGTVVFGPTAGAAYTVDGTNYLGDTLFTIKNSSNDVLTFSLTNITNFQDVNNYLQGSGTGTLTLTDPTDGQTTTTDGFFTLSTQPNTAGQPVNVSFSSTVSATPTPEPSSLLLLGTGLLGSAGMLYRRSRTSSAS